MKNPNKRIVPRNRRQPPQRSPSQDTATRAEVLNQAQRILVTLNAGGAVALLTFVKAVWIDWPAESLALVLDGVIWLLVGGRHRSRCGCDSIHQWTLTHKLQAVPQSLVVLHCFTLRRFGVVLCGRCD